MAADCTRVALVATDGGASPIGSAGLGSAVADAPQTSHQPSRILPEQPGDVG
jgi:hypothetical protein